MMRTMTELGGTMLYFRNLHNRCSMEATCRNADWVNSKKYCKLEALVGTKDPTPWVTIFVITRKKTSRFYQDIPAVNTDQAEHFCMATQGSVGIGLVFRVSDTDTHKNNNYIVHCSFPLSHEARQLWTTKHADIMRPVYDGNVPVVDCPLPFD